MSPKLLILFSTGFHWRIVLLSRANRLCSVFNTGLKDLESFVSQLIFCPQTGVKWLWFVCHEPCSKTNILILYFRWGEGSPTSVLGSQPIIWLLSLSPPDVRRPEVTKCEHLVSPAWPTFFPNGHLFDGWILLTQREDSISLTSIVSVGYHVTSPP